MDTSKMGGKSTRKNTSMLTNRQTIGRQTYKVIEGKNKGQQIEFTDGIRTQPLESQIDSFHFRPSSVSLSAPTFFYYHRLRSH